MWNRGCWSQGRGGGCFGGKDGCEGDVAGNYWGGEGCRVEGLGEGGEGECGKRCETHFGG